MTAREPGPVIGLVMPAWVEDWNHRSREHVAGPLGYTTIGMTYFARLDFVEAHLPTKRRPTWQTLRRSEIGLREPGSGSESSSAGEERYVLMPEVVRTTFLASASSRRGMKGELVRHLRDVLVNSYGTAEDVVERQLARISEQLSSRSVTINGEQREGWGTDEVPRVVALCAALDEDRFITAVVDRVIASALNPQFAEHPRSRD